jgi:GNAT superfamily N-acetyltransferase
MSLTPPVQLATSDEDILACHPVMHELRPHIDEEEFVSRVHAQAQVNDFQLAYLRDQNLIVAVAGFRIGYNLAWGHYLYVDDLVTRTTHRSQGFGAILLRWLHDFARKAGCDQLHLDSGLQRKSAHQFYERHGMPNTSLHFASVVKPNSA